MSTHVIYAILTFISLISGIFAIYEGFKKHKISFVIAVTITSIVLTILFILLGADSHDKESKNPNRIILLNDSMSVNVDHLDVSFNRLNCDTFPISMWNVPKGFYYKVEAKYGNLEI